MKPKILILFCGGTMVMVPDASGVLSPPSESDVLDAIVQIEPRIHDLATLDLAYLANIDSSDMSPKIWDALGETVIMRYGDYDGFVVLHGTDTLAYTASALSFALQNLGKPVVCTGAQIPGYRFESDARKNFINAIRLASMDLAEVVVLFGDYVLRGVRASKVSHFRLNAFSSVNTPPLGEVGTHIALTRNVRLRHPGIPHARSGYHPRVVVLSLMPGMPPSMLEHLFDMRISGIVLNAFGTGNLPHVCLAFLEEAQIRQIPVIIRTQCTEGATDMGMYATGRHALDCNAIEAHDMSAEATVTKLMWLLHQEVDYHEMGTKIHHNYVGEIRP